ncbi:MAG TPA: CpaD family pilus assembly lipoprotein [Dongiaceae bacterium]
MKANPIFLMLFSVILAGCQSHMKYADYDPHYAFPTTAVKKTAYLDLAPLQQGHVTALDSRRIDDFITAYHQQGEAPLWVTITAPSVNDPVGRRMASDAAVMLQKRGIRANEIRLFINESTVHAGPQLAFPIYVVMGRECGHWRTPVDQDSQGQNTDNFGCAVQQNIDVMAANPRDLLMPSPSSGRDSARSWMVVDNYHQGKGIPSADDIHWGLTTSVGQQSGQ